MDEVFDNESIWAFKVEYKPSRMTAEVAVVAERQAAGDKSVEASHHDGNEEGLATSHRDAQNTRI